MNEAKHTPGLQVLVGYFGEMISHHCSIAGCNDMPQDTFDCLSISQKEALLDDFHAWDKKSDPDGWEPRSFRRSPISSIPDFLWADYLMDRIMDLL